MDLNQSIIITSNSIFLNEQLKLLYGLERRLQQHKELSKYQEVFLQACDENRNLDWEEEQLDYADVL
jgi:hypothetical protein